MNIKWRYVCYKILIFFHKSVTFQYIFIPLRNSVGGINIRWMRNAAVSKNDITVKRKRVFSLIKLNALLRMSLIEKIWPKWRVRMFECKVVAGEREITVVNIFINNLLLFKIALCHCLYKFVLIVLWNTYVPRIRWATPTIYLYIWV